MNILLLGSGGREHALGWKMAQSPLLTQLYIAPGNGGTAEVGMNVDLNPNDFPSVISFIRSHAVDGVVVGPEDPLVNGIRDAIESKEDLKDVWMIGPGRAGAQLEGSKEFAKDFMQRHAIPTARYGTFTKDNISEGHDFLDTLAAPFVLKADGLAAGKGVLIIEDREEAKKELTSMLNGKFGAASAKVVIEEFLQGIELSVFVITDGTSYKVLPSAKDYKRIGEGDVGLNTGGMGAISPVPFADEAFLRKVEDRIVAPTINGLNAEEIPFCGFLFIGLMNVNGNPFVIEYNVRMGDPETEVVMPRLKTDLLSLLRAAGTKQLSAENPKFNSETAVTVMLVSGGYPEGYEKGKEISGLEKITESRIFHAGTKNDNGQLVTNGGRVLAITSLDAEREEALNKSYRSIDQIMFDQMNYRKDIGFDLR